jgi:hypothetical protein
MPYAIGWDRALSLVVAARPVRVSCMPVMVEADWLRAS